MVQLSNSGRVVYLVAVSQGRVFYANPGATAWTEATNNTGATPPLNFTGVLFSAANKQLLWFADGVNWCYFKPSTGAVETWAASAGTLPADAQNNTPRLIATWRGRTVLSGVLGDPQTVFLSAVDDPTNFDYAPLSTTASQAVSLTSGSQGLIGDVVTGLCPYTDDLLVLFGDGTIRMLSGDPMAGGRMDLISDGIGGAWGQCWAKDPYGNIYFVSNRTGIYTLVPGQQPVRISQQIEQLLQAVDTGANAIRLVWNDRFQGLHVFVSPLAAPAAATHFFYEKRTGAWWTDTFTNHNHDPLCCCTFDGNLPADRVALVGSWDGFVRSVSTPNATDDGIAIASSVVIGPLVTKDLDEILLKDIQGVLGETSGPVTFAVHVGRTAEQALSSTAVLTGTWSAGRNLSNLIRRSAHACYVKLSSTSVWAMETIRARVAAQGKVRRRGR